MQPPVLKSPVDTEALYATLLKQFQLLEKTLQDLETSSLKGEMKDLIVGIRRDAEEILRSMVQIVRKPGEPDVQLRTWDRSKE